ncbi:hypothetical protein BC628DRAFT_1055267 [Trametes gibbosa]|nr:hypothetical protein BC628DRAFT_1055267 [Trametes gibbosa]
MASMGGGRMSDSQARTAREPSLAPCCCSQEPSKEFLRGVLATEYVRRERTRRSDRIQIKYTRTPPAHTPLNAAWTTVGPYR